MNRRQLLAVLPALAPPLLASPLLALPLLATPHLARAQSPVQVTDILGRSVTLPRPAQRIVLAQARHVLAMALLHPDPVSLIVGWGDDLRRMNPPDYAAVRDRFPQADAIPILSRGQAESLSIEVLLASRPDLVIVSLALLDGLGRDFPDRLTAMGIPVAVIDFFVDPMRHTRQSIAVLGKVLGREDRAAAFDTFYTSQLTAIEQRLRDVTDRPGVFIHAHAGGTPCCFTPGRGAYDSMIRFAGGRNIAAEMVPTTVGQVSLEYLITQNPHVYVATGGPYGTRGGVPMGPGIPTAAATQALAEVIRRGHLDVLPAVRAGRAHAIWHAFNDTPAHLLMLLALARWFHPDRCGDLDIDAALAMLNTDFLSIPMRGALWATLPAGQF